jgi:hypothetical protein
VTAKVDIGDHDIGKIDCEDVVGIREEADTGHQYTFKDALMSLPRHDNGTHMVPGKGRRVDGCQCLTPFL